MSTETKKPRKALTPAQKAAKAAKAKATRERKAAAKEAAEQEIEETVEEVVPEEVPIEETATESVPEEIEAVPKEEPKVEEAPKSIRPTRQPKIITFEDVMKKWEALVDVLKAYLDQQQKSGKAWRHINQAHIVIKQHMLRFKRNQPE